MKKRYLIIIIMICLLLTGCGKENNTSDNKDNTNINESTNNETSSSNISINIGKKLEYTVENYNKEENDFQSATSLLLKDIKSSVCNTAYLSNYVEIFTQKNYESALKKIDELEECEKKRNEGRDPESDDYIKNEYDVTGYVNFLTPYFYHKNTTEEKEEEFIKYLITYYFNRELKENKYYVTLYPLYIDNRFSGYVVRYDTVRPGATDYEKVKREYDQKAKDYPKSYIEKFGLPKGYYEHEGIQLYNSLDFEDVLSIYSHQLPNLATTSLKNSVKFKNDTEFDITYEKDYYEYLKNNRNDPELKNFK